MLAEGLIHLRFMSPYTLFFINKKQGLCAEGRFTHPNFTVCIMQYAEVLKQKVLKQREIFFLRKSNLGILFSNNEWEANWVTEKMLFRECFQWWSKLHHAHIWYLWDFFILESLTQNNLTFHWNIFQDIHSPWSLPKAEKALLFVQKLGSISASASAFHGYLFSCRT